MAVGVMLVVGGCSGDDARRVEAPAHPEPIAWGFTENVHRDEPSTAQKLSVIREMGATMVRMDLDIGDAEMRSVRAIRADGLQVLGVLYGPREPGAYADHVERVVRTYAPLGVRHFELWNEPNVPFFWPTADNPDLATTEYMGLVRAAYPRIKAVLPDSVVLVGALSRREAVGGRPNDWVASMYDKGLKGNFDAISVHPYTEPSAPGDGSQAAFAWEEVAGPWSDRNPSVREQMVEQGDGGKSVWITEFAATTGGSVGTPVSEARQAEIARKAVSLARTYPWLGGFIWYTLRDSVSGSEQFGLLRADWSRKPAFQEVAAAVKASRGRPAGG